MDKPSIDQAPTAARQHGDAPTHNRFDRLELAGAFGDLGTLIPFVVAYITLLKLDPLGILFGFGVAMVCAGAYYKTPFPVQPMKAIGAVATTQAAQTVVIGAGAVYAASLVTGLVWLVLGMTGAAKRVADTVSRPVSIGIILGLGFGFMVEGVKMMSGNWWISSIGLAGTVLLLSNRAIPAMFLLLLFGAGTAILIDPRLLNELAQIRLDLRLPNFALSTISWSDVVVGTVFLALPQIPLTLGNAIIAVTDENNRLFPDRKVSEKGVAVSTGLLNLFGSTVGAIPMCHGAGGMAGHVRFGARTGGATIILGVILITLALFFSGSVDIIFKIFPMPILGVILFLTGSQLALTSIDIGNDRADQFVAIITAAFAMWNIGIAFLVGLSAYQALKRGYIRL